MLYKPFETIIVRIPLLPYEERLRFRFNDTQFEEALYLASPGLYEQKHRQSLSYTPHMERSLYKYWTRASTRCTPFGLFASWSTAQIGMKSKIRVSRPKEILRKNRLDMSVLCTIIQNIERNPEIRKHLVYFSNDTIYQIGDKIRFIEYEYENGQKKYYQQEVDWSQELNSIIENGVTGLTFQQAINLIVEKGFRQDESSEFIRELVDNQILKSNLEVDITADNPLDVLIKQLSVNKCNAEVIDRLKVIQNVLSIDLASSEHNSDVYQNITRHLQPLIPNLETKSILQTDTLRICEFATLSDSIVKEVCDVINFLTTWTQKNHIENMDRFIRLFGSKYEGEAIPLSLALDYESGIGYPPNASYAPIDSLIEGLTFTKHQTTDDRLSLSPLDVFILQQIFENGKNSEIHLEVFPINQTDPSSMDLPATVSVLFNLVVDNSGARRIIINTYGGATATSLIGRVAYLEKEIRDLYSSICRFEQQNVAKTEQVLAEIVHLPQDRTGNVIVRPLKRDAAIYYLAKHSTHDELEINVNDLLLSYDNETLHLTLKNDGREIIPLLSNAHYYSKNALPIYQFLGDYQYYNKVSLPFIDTSQILNILHYVPRIVYKNVILVSRTWLVDRTDLDKSISEHSIHQWQKKYGIPDEILICDEDNELYVHFNNPLGISVFEEMLHHRSRLIIKEVVGHPDDTISDVEGNVYQGEYCLSLYKS